MFIILLQKGKTKTYLTPDLFPEPNKSRLFSISISFFQQILQISASISMLISLQKRQKVCPPAGADLQLSEAIS
jgi:hypothetical protein